jgi:YbbR domain-containing protein
MFRRVLQSLSTMALSIILATMVWFVAVREENPPIEDDYGESIPLEVENLPPGTVIFGDVPDRVTLRLRAPQSSWEELSPAKFRAWIDLDGLIPGLHDVPVNLDVSDRSLVIVETRPGNVNVRLEPMVEDQFAIEVEVVDTAPLGYIARAPVVEPITATVSGPATVVNQIAQVWGETYLRGAKESVERSIDLVARDAEGTVLKGLTITPPKAHVVVPVDQRFGYRDVSVSTVISGEVAPGYWISNIIVDPSTVTIVGGPVTLNNIPGFVETSEVNVSDATDDIIERVPLSLPPGVSVVQPETQGTDNAGGVLVTVEISAIEGGKTVQRPVTFQGLRETRSATSSPSQVDVILSGPLPKLQALTARDVTVIADLFGLAPGIHKVELAVVVPEGLRVESVLPETVEIAITVGQSQTPTTETPISVGTSIPAP